MRGFRGFEGLFFSFFFLLFISCCWDWVLGVYFSSGGGVSFGCILSFLSFSFFPSRALSTSPRQHAGRLVLPHPPFRSSLTPRPDTSVHPLALTHSCGHLLRLDLMALTVFTLFWCFFFAPGLLTHTHTPLASSPSQPGRLWPSSHSFGFLFMPGLVLPSFLHGHAALRSLTVVTLSLSPSWSWSSSFFLSFFLSLFSFFSRVRWLTTYPTFLPDYSLQSIRESTAPGAWVKMVWMGFLRHVGMPCITFFCGGSWTLSRPGEGGGWVWFVFCSLRRRSCALWLGLKLWLGSSLCVWFLGVLFLGLCPSVVVGFGFVLVFFFVYLVSFFGLYICRICIAGVVGV